MDHDAFDKILVEEGIDDKNLRADLWYSRPSDDLDEASLRNSAQELEARLPELLTRQALNRAMDRELGRL